MGNSEAATVRSGLNAVSGAVVASGATSATGFSVFSTTGFVCTAGNGFIAGFAVSTGAELVQPAPKRATTEQTLTTRKKFVFIYLFGNIFTSTGQSLVIFLRLRLHSAYYEKLLFPYLWLRQQTEDGSFML